MSNRPIPRHTFGPRAVAGGYLAPATCFAPERSPDLSRVRSRMGDFAVDQLGETMGDGVVIGAALDEYQRLCPGAPAIAFCVDIAHSQKVAERLIARGYRAAHVHGDTPRDQRRRLIAALGAGELQVSCNCGLISEGLDVPGTVAAILLRPTKSLALYLQQIGRALRPAPGKQHALILDHAGNAFRHGLPDAARDWSLADRPRQGGEAPLKRCPECGTIIPLAASCPECGSVLRAPLAARAEINNRLVAVERLRVMSYRQALRWAGQNSGDCVRSPTPAATNQDGSGIASNSKAEVSHDERSRQVAGSGGAAFLRRAKSAAV
jgi:DNA repair protein RadD